MNTTEGMTIRQIAELCGVDVKTIRRWVDNMSTLPGQNVQAFSIIKQKMIEAGEKGEATLLDPIEVVAIIRAGGKESLAGVLSEKLQSENLPAFPSAIEAQTSAVGIYRDLIGQQKALIQSQAIAIEFLTREIQNLRRDTVTRMMAGLLPDNTNDGEWINTTELAAVYGKTRATTLSHARARGWPMRRGQLESGSFTFEFLVSGLPEKLQDALRTRREAVK